MFKKFIIVDKYGNFVGVDDYLIVRCVIVNVVMTMLTMTTTMMMLLMTMTTTMMAFVVD